MKELPHITRRTALGGGAAAAAAILLEACGGSAASGAAGASSTATTGTTTSSTATTVFGSTGAFRFTIVNHATSSALFVPTQNGAADACQLLGCSYEWTGSGTSDIGSMVNAIRAAVSDRVDGIATSIIDPTAFDAPVAAALEAGVPVVAYNADSSSNQRLAYIGQDLFRSGQEMGRRISSLLPGGGRIALFIARPGASDLDPRVDGVKNALKGSNITVDVVASGTSASADINTIEAWVGANPGYKGLFAVDAGSTSAVAAAIQKYNLVKQGVVGGGYDLTPTTQQLLADGYIDFAIDQQPYLQGFLSIVELYLYKVSEGLTGPADVDTGAKFVDKQTVAHYNNTNSRFEGTGTTPGVQS